MGQRLGAAGAKLTSLGGEGFRPQSSFSVTSPKCCNDVPGVPGASFEEPPVRNRRKSFWAMCDDPAEMAPVPLWP